MPAPTQSDPRRDYHAQDKVTDLNTALPDLPLSERIAHIASTFAKPVFTSSLGLEDQLITALIADHGRSIEIATLQTGRLFPQTLHLIDQTEEHFGLAIRRFEPSQDDVERYTANYGQNGFYDSVEARQACCKVRKLVPLSMALEGADAWVTGLRRDQSDNRHAIDFAQWDEERQLIKINPLADFTTRALTALIDAMEIPTNPLHARGYPSIGCEPCTRAIKPGEPERAGRWWWERNSTQECGLHHDHPTKNSKSDLIVEPSHG